MTLTFRERALPTRHRWGGEMPERPPLPRPHPCPALERAGGSRGACALGPRPGQRSSAPPPRQRRRLGALFPTQSCAGLPGSPGLRSFSPRDSGGAVVRAARRRGPDYKSQEASRGGARGTHAGSSRAKRDHFPARTPQPLPCSSQEFRGGRAENSIVRAGFPVASLVARTSPIVVVVNPASTKFLPSASSPPAPPAPPPPVCYTPLGSLRPHCQSS